MTAASSEQLPTNDGASAYLLHTAVLLLDALQDGRGGAVAPALQTAAALVGTQTMLISMGGVAR